MIDEHDLRSLLTEAAEAVPPPGRAPQALLDAIAEQASTPKARRPQPRRLTVLAAAAVVLFALVGVTLIRGPSSIDSTAMREGGDKATDEGSGDEALLETGAGAATGGGGGGGTTGGQAVDGVKNPVAPPTPHAPEAPSDSASGDAGAGAPPTDSAKVIRTGTLDIEVRKGTFQSVVDRITAQAVGLGGYVAEATTSESGESPSGSIKLRVPGDSFEQLLTSVRKLGDVKAVTSKGTDVTAKFTDLAARLTALTATRDRLHTVLAGAKNVPDILAVQDRITAVQIEIEKVQGEQKLLEDQTAMGTLAITLGEPGAEVIEAAPEGDGGLGGAWDDARRRFGDNIETIVSWSGSAAVALVVALGTLVLVRFAWAGMRRRLV